jgi:Ca2+-binding RTX toxin-like protein
MTMMSFRELSPAEYKRIRDQLLGDVEGRRSLPYLDTPQTKIPTIGIGFNLQDSNVRDAVLTQLGFNLNDSTDQAYRAQIANAVAPAAAASYKSNADLQAALNNIMKARHDAAQNASQPAANLPVTFSLSTNQMNKVLDTIQQTYEDRVDKWLPDIPNSYERAALFSLAYNGKINKDGTPTTLETSNGKSKLRDAIKADNRAAAWYEIAFDTDNQNNRRLYEAAEFGLYSQGSQLTISIPNYHSFSGNNHPSETDNGKEAITVFRFLDSKKKSMEQYLENAYSQNQDQVDKTYINGFYQPAKDELIRFFAAGRDIANAIVAPSDKGDTVHGPQNQQTNNGQVNSLIVGGNGSDKLFSDDNGNDILVGRSGKDTLVAGTGNNILIGSDGGGTFIGNTGNDTLFLNGPVYHLVTGNGPASDGAGSWKTPSGNSGVTTMLGGAGDDTLYVGSYGSVNNNIIIDGGAGTDVVNFKGSNAVKAFVQVGGTAPRGEVWGSEWNSVARRICCNSKNLRGARWRGSAAIFCPISPCT